MILHSNFRIHRMLIGLQSIFFGQIRYEKTFLEVKILFNLSMINEITLKEEPTINNYLSS